MEEHQTLSKTYPTYRSLGRPLLFMGFTGTQLLLMFGGTILLWKVVSEWMLLAPIGVYFLIGRPAQVAAKNGDYRYVDGKRLGIQLPDSATDREGFLGDL